mmetsp:Transcript_97888/g.277444  ORF Transcript_97888/g.277444 Transcript_97888/m.277444 type:complete len:247 (+) Transcript_97888:638-1378(+)
MATSMMASPPTSVPTHTGTLATSGDALCSILGGVRSWPAVSLAASSAAKSCGSASRRRSLEEPPVSAASWRATAATLRLLLGTERTSIVTVSVPFSPMCPPAASRALRPSVSMVSIGGPGPGAAARPEAPLASGRAAGRVGALAVAGATGAAAGQRPLPPQLVQTHFRPVVGPAQSLRVQEEPPQLVERDAPQVGLRDDTWGFPFYRREPAAPQRACQPRRKRPRGAATHRILGSRGRRQTGAWAV